MSEGDGIASGVDSDETQAPSTSNRFVIVLDTQLASNFGGFM